MISSKSYFNNKAVTSFLTVAIALVFSLTSHAQLSGTYTIGATGTYLTFSEAVDSLVSLGVSGPVIMNVEDGSYNEQITIPAIAGASAANTITFQSLTGDSTAVLMFFSSTGTSDNYVIKLDGANYINFNQLSIAAVGTSYSRCFYFLGGASNDTITNSVLTAPTTSNTSPNLAIIYGYNTPDEYNVIQNNLIVNGSYGLLLRGTSTSVLAAGNVVQNNQIVGSYNYGMAFRHQSATQITGNTVTMSAGTASGSAIYLNYSDNDILISGNTVDMVNGGYGIYLNACDGNIAQKGEVSNNMVRVGGSSTAYGILCNTSTYQNIFHNSTHVKGTSSAGRAFAAINGNNLDVRNNSFVNYAWGYAYHTNSSTNIIVSDYNNIYSTANLIANWNGDLGDFPALQAASGKDVNSVSVHPDYLSTTDLHTNIYTLEGIADPTVGIGVDIDGDLRSGTPDIGADEFTGVGVPMAGTYTIGGTTPDFTTITQAVDSLNIVGISASVIFDIRDGNYNEQFQVRPITGSSMTKTVTFQSENRDSSLVDISYAATSSNPYVFRLRAADYVIIRDLTITAAGTGNGVAIRISGNTRVDSIYNCEIIGNTGVSSDASIHGNEALFEYIVIQNTSFSSGYYGIRLDNLDGTYPKGIEVTDNIFAGQSEYSIYLEDLDAAIVVNNTISVTGHTGFTCIYMNDVENDFVVTDNNILSPGGTDGGIRVDYCTGTSSKRGLIANNVIAAGGTANAFGIYTRNSDYVNVFYNSARISSSSNTGGIGYYCYSGSNMDVRNNVFANTGGGYSYYSNSSTAVTSSDYNDLYTNGNFIGAWNSATKTDLADFQSANSMDANSIDVNPNFVSSTDLHATSSFINNLGTPIGLISVDMDGEARDGTNPDMGADEFTPDTNLTPLVGVYTIGGSTPDYVSFTTAVDDLNLRGISGTVTFNVRPNTYSEQVVVLPISGASATDTVVFQSENGDSSTTVMTYSASTIGDDYVFRIYGASYVTVQKMTLAATGTTYSKVIHLNGMVSSVNINNNILAGTNNANSSIIHTTGDILSDIRVTSNVISEGSWGVYINADNNTHAPGIEVNYNIITGNKTVAIRLEDCSAPIVMYNDCSNTGSNYDGIVLSDCDNNFKVVGNKVVSTGTYSGIYIYACNGSSPFRGLVANNFCTIGGTSSAYGIQVYNSSYINVYHNNLNVTSTSTNGRSLYIANGGSNINVKNNNLTNTGPGYAFYVSSASAVVSSDNNNLTSTGTNLGYWGATVATLTDLQTLSGMDANSMSVNPGYFSSTDLHVSEIALMGTATPVGVLDDYDGHTRDLVTPDIGADEFYCEPPTFSVLISDPCLGDSTTFWDNSTGIEPGSTWDWDFDNDFTVDYSSNTAGEMFKHLYSSGGTQTANLIVSQIAGCVDTLVMAPVVNTFPVLALTSTGVYCDSSNGTASVVATGGTAPYIYTWSSGSTSSMNMGLDLGLYTVAVTDINNCTTLDTVSVKESMSASINLISGSTCGNSDGIAQVTNVTGGFPPYDYVWSTGDTTDTDSNLYSGIHYVSVIDVNGCVAFATINVSDIGAGVSIGLVSKTNNNCSGEQNGAINIAVGGTSPFTFTWSNAETTEDVSGLGEGIYEIVVTDANGCVATDTYTIIAPDAISATVVVSHASCGASDGSAVVVANGGIQPYAYAWSNGGSNQVKAGLAAGIYLVSVTDANGCVKVAGVVVSNIGGPVITMNSVTEVTCLSPSIGAININVTGGLPGYSFIWSNAATTEDINGLTVGNYTVTVTDTNGCAATASVDIMESTPAKPDICIVTVDTITGTNIVVWEKQGGQNIDYYNIYKEGTASGIYLLVGTRLYDSLSVFVDSFADPQLRSWRYRISAVDSCGQESQKSGIHKTLHLTVNLGLAGEVNLIWDEYSGGFILSTYEILRGPSVASLSTIGFIAAGNHTYVDPAPPAGTQVYVVSALHPNGCTATKQKNFNSSKSNTSSVGGAADTLGASIASNNATQGNCDGSATYSVTGGVPPYAYSWSTTPVQTDSVATGLCAGSYGVTVTDALGDTLSSSITITENQNLGGTTSSTNATAGNCDGTATAMATGGTPPYTYTWSTVPAQTDSVAIGLCAGNYTCIIQDAAGASMNVSATVAEDQPLAAVVTPADASFGVCNGTATAAVTGGFPPYTYTWSTVPAQTGLTATGLCPGSYTLIVQDSTGGIITAAATIGELTSILDLNLDESLMLYPNPNQGTFNLSFVYQTEGDVLIRIFDMKGGIIWEQRTLTSLNRTSVDIDLEGAVSGLYQLQILSETGMTTRKVMIR